MILKNVPRSRDELRIKGGFNEQWGVHVASHSDYGAVLMYSLPYHHKLVDFFHDNPGLATWFADEFAALICSARDVGFEQGRAHVREALGVK